MVLPGRSPAEEDAFVARFRDEGHQDLVDAITAAVEGRRLSLAARLVGLLEHDVDHPAIERARAATAFMLHQGHTAADVSWSEIDDAVREIRQTRMRAHRARQRDRLRDPGKGPSRRISRVDRKRR